MIRTSEILIFTTLLTCEILYKINKRSLQYKTYLNMIVFNNKRIIIIKNLN